MKQRILTPCSSPNVLELFFDTCRFRHWKGFDVCRRIKANPRTRQIGVIMLTADSEKGTVVECVEAGADGYLLKPYDAARLLDKVRKILPKARRQLEAPRRSRKLQRRIPRRAGKNRRGIRRPPRRR